MYSCYDPESLFLPHVENIFADSCVQAGTWQGWLTDMSKDWFHMNLEEHLEETIVFPMIYGYLWYFPANVPFNSIPRTSWRATSCSWSHARTFPEAIGGVFSWKRNPAVTTMRDDTMTLQEHIEPWTVLFKYLRLELTWSTISIHISHHVWWQRPPPAAQTPKMCSMSATAWAGPQFRHPDIRQPDEVKGLTMPWPSSVFFRRGTRRDSHVFQSFWWNEPIIPGGYPPEPFPFHSASSFLKWTWQYNCVYILIRKEHTFPQPKVLNPTSNSMWLRILRSIQ